MGFDFCIDLVLNICSETGKPYVFSKDSKKLYELPTLNIPNMYLPFVQDRGRLYHVYTDHFSEDNRYTATTEELLENFPEWDEVKSSIWYEGYTDEFWSEQKHNVFRQALQWFAGQPYTFQASWSY